MLRDNLLDLADSLESEAKATRTETQSPRGLGFAAGLTEAAERIRQTINHAPPDEPHPWADWGHV